MPHFLTPLNPAPFIIPFSIEMVMNGTNAALTPAAASAALGTELFSTSKACRNIVDLSRARWVRLVGVVIANGTVATATFKLSYATTESSTWAGTDTGCALPVGTGTAGLTRDSGWVALPVGAQVDNCHLSLLVGGAAIGTTPPTVGSITAYFR